MTSMNKTAQLRNRKRLLKHVNKILIFPELLHHLPDLTWPFKTLKMITS